MTEIQESQPEPKIDPLGHHIAWSTINGIYVLNVESGEQKVHEIEEDGFSGYEIAFIDENKVLWGYGKNEYGQLGDGSTENKFTPIKIMDNVVAIFAGGECTAAIKEDGRIKRTRNYQFYRKCRQKDTSQSLFECSNR